MPRIVVSTAKLKCDRGSDYSPLISTGLGQVEVVLQAAATVEDHTPGKNIFPFGRCDVLGGPCVPTTPAPWAPGASLSLMGAPVLREDAKLGCTHCGTIEVVDPGQHEVDVDAEQWEFQENFAKLIEGMSSDVLNDFLQNMAIAGVLMVPGSALDRVGEDIKKAIKKPNLSERAIAELNNASKLLKTLKGANVAVGTVLDFAKLVEALKREDYEEAAAKAGGIAAGVATGLACASGLAPLATATGPAAPVTGAGAGVVCAAAGFWVGVGAEGLIKKIL